MQSFLTFLLAVLAVTNGFAPTVQTRVLASRPSTFLQMAGDIKISAKMVSELRQKTDSPMMECKKALIEANGDFAAAEEILRVKLGSKASKKAGRIAAEGVAVAMIEGDAGVLFEANCETDFVSKNPDFIDFTKNVASGVMKGDFADVDALNNSPMGGGTVESTRADLVGKIGENMSIRRFKKFSNGGKLASYVHGGSGADRASMGKIAVIVEYEGSQEAATDIAMHIACNKPSGLTAADVPQDVLDQERKVAELKAAESGKPEAIAAKMVEGQVQKYLKEVTLTSQPFVKDPGMNVETYLKNADTTIKSYAFYVVGEGIEKKEDTFVAEVEAAAAKVAAAAAAAGN